MTQWGLDTLFNPAKRHMDEEKQRLQSTREQIGDSSGGKRIDLDSGRATIPRGADEAQDDAAGAETTDDAAATDEAGTTRSAAQRRAAERRVKRVAGSRSTPR